MFNEMARAPKKSVTEFILPVPHFLVCNPAFGRGVQRTVVRSILLCGCEAWPVRVAEGRVLEVFENDAASFTRDTEIAYRRQNCGAASASLAYRRSSSKEGFVGSVMLQDVPTVN